MRETVPGHLYELDSLRSKVRHKFKFYRDPSIHAQGWPGPSTQEVLRMCIARVKYLNKEVPWWGNQFIIALLRWSIFLFELRHLLRKARKSGGIENLKTRNDGHVY